VAKLASHRYLAVHSLLKEDRYETSDARSGKIDDLFVPESRLCAVSSPRCRQPCPSLLDRHAHAYRTAALHRLRPGVLGARRHRRHLCGRSHDRLSLPRGGGAAGHNPSPAGGAGRGRARRAGGRGACHTATHTGCLGPDGLGSEELVAPVGRLRPAHAGARGGADRPGRGAHPASPALAQRGVEALHGRAPPGRGGGVSSAATRQGRPQAKSSPQETTGEEGKPRLQAA
jgi:hypothetical protein